MSDSALVVFAGEWPQKREFAHVFNRMAVAFAKDADAATLRVYYDALSGLPAAAVAQAADYIMREAGRTFFPSTGEWFGVASQIANDLLRTAIAPVRDDWQDYCDLCHDTGWQIGSCLGDGGCGMRSCAKFARISIGYAHTYATPCPCRPRNPTYQRSVQQGIVH